MLLRGSAEYIQQSKVVCMLDTPASADIDTHFPTSRVLNTHYPLDVLPKQFHDRKTVLGKDKISLRDSFLINCCESTSPINKSRNNIYIYICRIAMLIIPVYCCNLVS